MGGSIIFALCGFDPDLMARAVGQNRLDIIVAMIIGIEGLFLVGRILSGPAEGL